MTKKVCYTCITGGYDSVPTHKYIDPSWDYVLFTDNHELIRCGHVGPYVVRQLARHKYGNVKNARWHKINAHILFPEYDISLWMDGNVSILNNHIFDIANKLIANNTKIAIPMHPERNCIYAEAETIKRLHIDHKNIVNREMKKLHRDGYPENNGLSETNIMFRRHNEIISTLNLWWHMVKNYSKRDQLSYNYAAWKYGVQTIPLYPTPGEHRTNGDFELQYIATHNQDKITKHRKVPMKIFYKERCPNGRRHIYFCGIKILSYKRRQTTKQTIVYSDTLSRQQIVRYCGADRLPILLRDRFYERTGKLPTEELTTFRDKVIWASMFDVTPLKIQCADKLAVRKYVCDKIGDKYLPKLYATYKNSDEFILDKLPQSFVLTYNAGSGQNLLVFDKTKFSPQELKQTVKEWLLYNHSELFCEMQYRYIPPRVIAREMVDIRTDIEYKMWCFGGRVEFIVLNCYQDGHNNIRIKTKSRDWSDLDFNQSDYGIAGIISTDIERPDFLNELIEITEKLAEPFDFVRVDFYETKDGKLVFGELTFSPTAGNLVYAPDDNATQHKLGQLFKIPPRDENGFATR
ncbi:MAG: DUF616 domain-containing protein [Alphaproteobacteria bacterium]|nr:DUF616 domain-containing protein [Alphaproteobacteria bacterium]